MQSRDHVYSHTPLENVVLFLCQKGRKKGKKKERKKQVVNLLCVSHDSDNSTPVGQTLRHACEVLHYTQKRWPVYDVETAKKREDASQVPVSSPI